MNHFVVLKSSFLALMLTTASSVYSNELSLAQALDYALDNEPWLTANKYQQAAVQAQSLAAGTLPDPVLSLGLMNLPTDGFAFDQEGMTQLKVGVSQMFSRGDSLELKQQALAQSAQQYPWLRADRLAQVKTIVIESWLNAYRAQQSIALIEQDKALFTQLIDITESSYASSVGKTRQQDIIRAQLELTRLEDKLVMLEQQFESAKKRMSQWLPMSMLTQPVSAKRNDISPLVDFAALKFEQLMPLLIAHPAIVAIEQSVAAKQTEIAVAKQSYKPQFGVNMGYGYRDDTLMGDSRADLFSVGISIDLPLFTDNRQDQQVNAAIAMAESAKTEKLIALQKLKGMYFKEFSQLSRLQQRDALYQTKLLPQMAEQAQATLNAYTRDDGDFSEVMRARISELNAKIDALNIEIDQQIIIARLNYYASSKDAAVMAELVAGEHNEH
ncbi:TolC family protein [Pseudoalteromonas sp. KG3]|uniref:TolC family protein n=1 Tax=Pseudoalteromonas prydzensis TaxID=182141 RepID=A0ABR9FPI7_9GAMM|nr:MULTISPECIES: TolC family protein [Pseudoalteromonas]MBE0458741.1 TolC family protein [Pseudoalteromonas prydzensis]WKD22099.1 TolC family protein [Pseudoalteromonas sp. KG3]